MNDMRAGLLKHWVTLQQPTSVPDGDGGYTESAPVIASNVPAAIEPALNSDMERAIAGTVQSVATHIVTIRHRGGVSTATRVLFGSRVLEVVAVQNIHEDDVWLSLFCKEKIA